MKHKRRLRKPAWLVIILCSVAATITPSCDRRPSNETAIVELIQAGDTNRLHQLLSDGLSPNRRIQYSKSVSTRAPLIHIAVRFSRVDIVRLLLTRGADPNSRDDSGFTVLNWAVGMTERGSPLAPEIVALLLQAGADPNLGSAMSHDTPLLDASEFGNLDILEILLRSGAQVNATNSLGETALHVAKNPEIANALLAAGADLSLRNTAGATAVEEASRAGRSAVVLAIRNHSRNQKVAP